MTMTRRAALAGITATAGLVAAAAGAQTGDLLIADAHVLTMDDTLGDLPRGDVLVRGGRIAAVGNAHPRTGATVIEAGGAILLPGLIDTHWHMWNEIARNWAASDTGGFGPTMAAFAPVWSPADSAASVTLALAEAIESGITTVYNWAHNTRSPAHARAEYRAQA